MKRKFNLGAIVATALAAVLPMMPSPAGAVAATAITGGGTISPGVPGPTGGTVANSVAFGGTATGVFTGGPDAGSCTIGFSGTETDSTALGSGSGVFNCNGTGLLGRTIALANCNISYTRVGELVIVTVSGGNCGLGIWVCIWIPGNVNPTTNYSMACVIVVTG